MVNAHFQLGCLTLALVAAGFAPPASALYPRPILEHVHEDDRDALLELALQPAAVREAVLQVAREPGGIARLQGVRTWAERSFRALLDEHSPERRVVLWTLAHHPELVHALALRELQAASSREQLAESYPEAVVEAAVACDGGCRATLVRIDALNAETGAAVEAELDAIPASAREAFRAVLAAPGVLNLLTDQMRLTVALAEAHARDPQRTLAALSELHAQLADAEAIRSEATATEGYEPEPARTASVVRVPYGSYWAGYPYYAYGYGVSYPRYVYRYGSLVPYAGYRYYGSPYGVSFAYGLRFGFGHHRGHGHGGHHVGHGPGHHGERGKHLGGGHRRRGGHGHHVGRGPAHRGRHKHRGGQGFIRGTRIGAGGGEGSRGTVRVIRDNGRNGRARPAVSSSPRRGHPKHRASGGSPPSVKGKGKAHPLRRLKSTGVVRVADAGRGRGGSRQHRRRR